LEAELDAKVNALYGLAPSTNVAKAAVMLSPATSNATGTVTRGMTRIRHTEAGMKELLRDQVIPKLPT